MDRRRLACALLLLALACGCAHSVRLKQTPAAKGGEARVRVELTYDRNNTLIIKFNGPEPTVYGASYTRYVAWVAPPDPSPAARDRAINVGQIRVEGGKGDLKTLTPLRKFHFFLTVEERGDAQRPGPQVVFETEKDIDW